VLTYSFLISCKAKKSQSVRNIHVLFIPHDYISTDEKGQVISLIKSLLRRKVATCGQIAYLRDLGSHKEDII